MTHNVFLIPHAFGMISGIAHLVTCPVPPPQAPVQNVLISGWGPGKRWWDFLLKRHRRVHRREKGEQSSTRGRGYVRHSWEVRFGCLEECWEWGMCWRGVQRSWCETRGFGRLSFSRSLLNADQEMQKDQTSILCVAGLSSFQFYSAADMDGLMGNWVWLGSHVSSQIISWLLITVDLDYSEVPP